VGHDHDLLLVADRPMARRAAGRVGHVVEVHRHMLAAADANEAEAIERRSH